MLVTINGNTLSPKNVVAIPTTEEQIDKGLDWFGKAGTVLLTTYTYSRLATRTVLAAGAANPEAIRQGFHRIIDVFTAVAEPILWGYAVIGLVLVATGNSNRGWARVKNVAYAYIGITCLPAFFSFLRYLGQIIASAFAG